MFRVVLAALLFVSLAGCAEDAPGANAGVPCAEGHRDSGSREELAFDISASGPFKIRVPLVVSPGGTELADWNAAHAHKPGDRIVQTSQGHALELLGSGSRVASLCVERPPESGHGEEYLDGEWTTKPGATRPQTIPIEVLGGNPDVAIAYEASSASCNRRADFAGVALANGWHDLAGEDAAWCQ